jgi:adenylate cyclase
VVGNHFRLRKIDVICVKGKLQPIAVYELMSDDLKNAALAELASEYEAALDCYQKQKWDESEQRIVGILKKFPDDGPCRTLIKRIAAYRHDPPPPGWDGVFIAKEK